MLLLPFFLLLQSPDAETYDALISCAAFHAIEGERLAREKGEAASDAQSALSGDFAQAAAAIAAEQAKEANDLARRTADYKAKLSNGDVRETAQQWTALELACTELHPMLVSIRARSSAAMDSR